jgi:hypothetical protein
MKIFATRHKADLLTLAAVAVLMMVAFKLNIPQREIAALADILPMIP